MSETTTQPKSPQSEPGASAVGESLDERTAGVSHVFDLVLEITEHNPRIRQIIEEVAPEIFRKQSELSPDEFLAWRFEWLRERLRQLPDDNPEKILTLKNPK